MQTATHQTPVAFPDRRRNHELDHHAGPERRQFSNSYESASPEVAELATAVDQYKLRHRRRFITFEELHNVLVGLGYHK